jgi:hypothetical protein
MNDRAIAHGRAAHATVRWLHARPVKPISLQQPIDYAADPPPKSRDQIEEAIRLALAAGAGEMLHLGAPPTHLQHETPGVANALRLARKLPGRDPVDVLEEQLDHTCAAITSPKIWHATEKLAGALLQAPRGEMSGDDARRVIERAVRDPRSAKADCPGHPRKIIIRRAPRD